MVPLLVGLGEAEGIMVEGFAGRKSLILVGGETETEREEEEEQEEEEEEEEKKTRRRRKRRKELKAGREEEQKIKRRRRRSRRARDKMEFPMAPSPARPTSEAPSPPRMFSHYESIGGLIC